MGFLHGLKLWLSPPKIIDPEFGRLVFMHISNAPERSYWEGEWLFAKSKSTVGITLRGGESGPADEARRFYLELPGRFDAILAVARPKLAEAYEHWIEQDLPEDIFSVLTLTGFHVDDPRARPLEWDVSFETKGEKWISITVPFVGDTPEDAIVDT